MSLRLPDSITAPCLRFLDLLDRWNHTHALTSLPGELRFEELILDSWALVPSLFGLEPGSRVVDFGTGMGIPAVVLALARPDLEVIALDKAHKKIAFVRQAALELELANLRPITARAEDLAPLGAHLGVAKAVGAPALLARWWIRHGLVGAPLLLLKGEAWEGEEKPDGDWAFVAHPYRLPTRGDRFILEMRKKPTS